MKSQLATSLGIVLLLACGCASSADYVIDAPERVKAADWSRVEEFTVVLDEYSFAPVNLLFKQNVPYKLTIRNAGSEKHYFTAEQFFRSIATRKAQDSDAEFKVPYFSAIEVFPGHAVDLYFIPVRAGRYELLCTIPGHADSGMTGTIEIR